jgi:YndJ-like protein
MSTFTKWPRLVAYGALLWGVTALLSHPHPLTPFWPQLLTVLGAMVAVPLGLEVLRRQQVADIAIPPAGWAGAWLLLSLNFLAGGGTVTGVASLGWLGVTIAIGWQALAAWRHGPRGAARTVCLCGPLMLPVGGAWLAADWLAIQPLDFNYLIVRLTAAHFHFAGFVLPLIAGLLMHTWHRPVMRIAGIGTVAGMPLVATGITLTRYGAPVEIECVLALAYALCAAATGAALAAQGLCGVRQTRLVRGLLILSGLSLLAAMTLAALYALRPWLQLPWLHLPSMWAWHGSLQVFGFALPALAAWALHPAPATPDEVPELLPTA